MWENETYCWVVLCKNRWYHLRQNLFHGHRIPLAVTDGVSSGPAIHKPFEVRCDDCGKTYVYKPSEVLRYEQEPATDFTPHPLFREE